MADRGDWDMQAEVEERLAQAGREAEVQAAMQARLQAEEPARRQAELQRVRDECIMLLVEFFERMEACGNPGSVRFKGVRGVTRGWLMSGSSVHDTGHRIVVNSGEVLCKDARWFKANDGYKFESPGTTYAARPLHDWKVWKKESWADPRGPNNVLLSFLQDELYRLRQQMT